MIMIYRILLLLSFIFCMYINFKLILNKNRSSLYFPYLFLNISITGWVLFGMLRISVAGYKYGETILLLNRLSWSFAGFLFLNFIYNFLKLRKNFLFWFSAVVSSAGFIIINFTDLAFSKEFFIRSYGISGVYTEHFLVIILVNSGIPILTGIVFLIEYIIKNGYKKSIPETTILIGTIVGYLAILYFDVITPSVFLKDFSLTGNLYASFASLVFYYSVSMKKKILYNDLEYSSMLVDKIDDCIIICDNLHKVISYNNSSVSEKLKKNSDIRDFLNEKNIIDNIFLSEDEYFNFKVTKKRLSFGNFKYGYVYIFKKIPLNFPDIKTISSRNMNSENYTDVKYKAIFENRKEAIFLFSADTGKLVKCNKAFCSLYGYNEEEVKELSIFDLSGAKENDIKYLEKAKNKKGPLETLYLNHYTKEKSVFPVEISGYVFNINEHSYVVSVITDLNKISLKEKILVDSKKRLLSNRILSSLANEFKNYYSEILLNIEKLEYKDNEENLTFFSKIKTASLRGLELSKLLLSFSKKEDIKVETIEVRDFVEDVLNLFKNNCSNKNIKVFVDIKKNRYITISPADFRKIIMILIQNAEHAVLNKAEPYIKITLDSDEEFTYIYVEDNGRGILKKDIKNIFLPFYSLKGEFAQKDDVWHNIEGNGLGLPIACVIALEYKGSVELVSTSEKGSRFVFKVPMLVTGN